jgi:hypothetical protein
VKRSMIFGAALILSSVNAYADAMGKGLGVDMAPQAQGQAAVQAKMIKGKPSPSLSVSIPVELPHNPQCVSGGQPCAEAAQKAADAFKKEKGIR